MIHMMFKIHYLECYSIIYDFTCRYSNISMKKLYPFHPLGNHDLLAQRRRPCNPEFSERTGVG